VTTQHKSALAETCCMPFETLVYSVGKSIWWFWFLQCLSCY
jgi:hypothetical protein